MKALIQRIPFPFVGYVLVLIGFAGLGLSVATLAHGMPAAPYLGIATVAAYGLATWCFRFRGRQIRTADASAPTVLHADLMVPDTDRRDTERYLRTYRGLENHRVENPRDTTLTPRPPAAAGPVHDPVREAA
ncbi:MAG: hypothetical protein K0R68_1523 [Mycobacterium sp.]|nr:hypothetical protein [Mycobacterium sp.]